MQGQILVRIDEELKLKLNKIARLEGKASSEVIRELIEQYVKERDISAYIDNLWERIGNKLRAKGAKPEDIETAIKEVRRQSK